VCARTSAVRGTRRSSHSPASVVTGTLIAVTTASAAVASVSRWRAAGHTATSTTASAVSGTKTITAWTSRM